MKELVEVIAKGLVSDPDQVRVEEFEQGGETVIKLHVAEDDMGKVIGHAGRIAKAIRVIVKAAAVKEDKQVTVDIE
ncbi:MAG: KH domain-containing protein [Lachnospiraceae bacterium]|nr:KH domain-containing protein [Lachnospiraceae bacterium]